jgi:hypothetical protein
MELVIMRQIRFRLAATLLAVSVIRSSGSARLRQSESLVKPNYDALPQAQRKRTFKFVDMSSRVAPSKDIYHLMGIR